MGSVEARDDQDRQLGQAGAEGGIVAAELAEPLRPGAEFGAVDPSPQRGRDAAALAGHGLVGDASLRLRHLLARQIADSHRLILDNRGGRPPAALTRRGGGGLVFSQPASQPDRGGSAERRWTSGSCATSCRSRGPGASAPRRAGSRAQPALSRQLKKLEDELGVQLLVRHGRGVEITEAGAIPARRGEALIDHIGQTVDRAAAAARPSPARLALGVAPTSGLLIVPEIYEQFRAALARGHPGDPRGHQHPLEEWLLDRRIDMPSCTIRCRSKASRCARSCTSAWCWPVSPITRRRREGIGFSDLPEVPLILPSLPQQPAG